jgi:threonine dehydrogenase-like Zn-dependent dehydrogenase
MKAIIASGPKNLVLTEVEEIGQLEFGQVGVRLELASICGTDKPGFLRGLDPIGHKQAGFPSHECLGTIISAPGEDSIIGKRVISIPDNDAGLKEIFIASREKTHVINSDLPSEVVILAQPLATVLAALDRLTDLEGKRVAIVGLGPIGLMFGFVLKSLGVAEIVGFDLRDRTGAPLLEAFDVVRSSYDNHGEYDIVIEAVGHNQQVVNQAIELTKDFGTLLIFGVPDDEVYQFNFSRFFRKRISLIANVNPNWPEYFPKAEKYLQGNPQLSKIVTHRFDIDSVKQAYETAFTNQVPSSGKMSITMESWQ